MAKNPAFVKGTKCWQTFVQFLQNYIKINAHMMKKKHCKCGSKELKNDFWHTN